MCSTFVTSNAHTHYNVSLKDKHVNMQLYNLLYNRGFAIIKDHDVELQLLADVYSVWSSFFSNEDKYKYLRSDSNDEGYVPINTEKAVGYDIADYKEFYQTHECGMYPAMPNLASTKRVTNELIALGETLIKLIDVQIPASIKEKMTTSLSEMITNSDKHGFRVVHYPNVTSTTSPRAAEHGDICLLTLLPSPAGEGLELKDREGVWHKPVIEKSDIIVFNSDMLEICTRGYMKSTTHKVSINAKQINFGSRYSLPVFIHPRRDVYLTKNTTALSVLRKRLSEIGFNGNLLKY